MAKVFNARNFEHIFNSHFQLLDCFTRKIEAPNDAIAH